MWLDTSKPIDEAEYQYYWWLENNHPEEYRRRMEEDDWEWEFWRELRRSYRKPIYDPFEVFQPTKAMMTEVKKQLIKQSYEHQERKNNAQGYEREVIEQAHQKLIAKIREVDYYIKGGRNKKEVGATEIAQAKAVPISELYTERLRRAGTNYVGRCPFHDEKTPSFTIYSRNNSWYCYGGCGTGGDSIAYVMKLRDLSFIEAVKYLIGKV